VKTPNPKHQTPEKLQAPSAKTMTKDRIKTSNPKPQTTNMNSEFSVFGRSFVPCLPSSASAQSGGCPTLAENGFQSLKTLITPITPITLNPKKLNYPNT
jgi:hypothetical protein